jgi:hypothetical protein
VTERRASAVERALRNPERAPLGSLLREDLSERRLKAMWERIDHAPRRGPAVWLVAAVTATLVALSLFVAQRQAHSGRLALSSGAVPGVLEAGAAPATPRFEDGSMVSLGKGTRLEVLRNDGRSFVTALRRGDATFDVEPGGERHWIIEAGELSVEVVGTRFRVQRDTDLTKVTVQHGIVLVRGARVPDGSLRLLAGEGFELRAPVATAPAASAPPAPAMSGNPLAPPQELRAPVVASPISSASATSGPASSGRQPRDDVERSLWEADAARAHRDSSGAARHFEAAWLRAAPGDPRRGLAGLSLARLLIGVDPVKAARVLRSSLPDMPQALLEDSLARLVEAESRGGDAAAAARAADDYLRRFPNGLRAEEVRRWAER